VALLLEREVQSGTGLPDPHSDARVLRKRVVLGEAADLKRRIRATRRQEAGLRARHSGGAAGQIHGQRLDEHATRDVVLLGRLLCGHSPDPGQPAPDRAQSAEGVPGVRLSVVERGQQGARWGQAAVRQRFPWPQWSRGREALVLLGERKAAVCAFEQDEVDQARQCPRCPRIQAAVKHDGACRGSRVHMRGHHTIIA